MSVKKLKYPGLVPMAGEYRLFAQLKSGRQSGKNSPPEWRPLAAKRPYFGEPIAQER
jgi:hypothetical protein